MTAHGWFVLAMVVLPAAGFTLWLWGHFLKARREAADMVLRNGVPARAEVVGISGQTISFRFQANGWKHPITASAAAARGSRFEIGQQIQVRYLSAHPHISVIVAADG